MKRLMKNERGFTLIEVLIVVAILGVLAVVIIPNLGNMLGVADKSAANIEADVMRTAILAYKVDNDGAIPEGEYGKDNVGILEEYVQKNLVHSYIVGENGDLEGVDEGNLIWENDLWDTKD